ncbi:Ppx/GppA family phosphatase [Altererythrobacter arenosus]|uniref:Ppx/GppA family phosphatase n=1 Tax=Altererythrobacter arenosus TaxID=3032592 RepID=A0ABY8FVM6_9SPHN|nr:Ppx/GppA family phosphatase [Altererythrobacter sp. CAU 1644]WFL78140.1 Ppx/GppA family phosphatase [Altererythrobacter sp. CAU 1644]
MNGRTRQTRRAVIDIGSNTVRLVIYEGPQRAPEVFWNEKVAARLGQNLSTTGEIPEAAAEEALGALARYELIIRDLGVEDVQTVATAAAREATNGAEFLGRVAALGLEPRLLAGEEEARFSAMGAIGAFPGAHGVVADLGGGSLELVSIADGDSHHGSSLPLGTLRLPALRKKKGFGKSIRKAFASVGWAHAHEGPLYMVGGTWRALARFAMNRIDYPLTDPHGFELEVDEAMELCGKLARAKPEKLASMGGITPMRAGYLPDAGALLKVMLDEFQPEKLVFSSWGIREGLLFDRLDPLRKTQDPLLAGVNAFCEIREATITHATRVAGWTVEIAGGPSGGNGTSNGNERLRLAAAQLANALQRVEPNLRINHATEWALDKRWINCDARDRAMICAALFGSLGRTALPDSFRRLAEDDDLRRGIAWGLGIRLARRMSAGARESIAMSSLSRKKNKLVLTLEPSRAALAHYPLTFDLEVLANWLDLKPEIKIGEVAPAEI